MVKLSNVDIEKYIKEGKIKIDPYDSKRIQGATVDFRLGKGFLIPDYQNGKNQSGIIELDREVNYRKVNSNEIIIPSLHFVLGTTLERLIISEHFSASVDGKSRVGRKGLIVQTAGHIGPGFDGEITLELFNANQMPIRICYGQEICQIEFDELKTPSTKPYKGRFFGQKGPKA